MLLSTILDTLYEKTLEFGRRKLWLLILGIVFIAVVFINGVGVIPEQHYQRLSQNPFITRTDIHFNNYWQETLLLPILAFYLRLTSPLAFNITCFVILVAAFLLFAILTFKRWNSASALVFSTLLITSPLTTVLLAWLGSPDGLTVALTIPFLFTNSNLLLFFLAMLGATNHPAFMIATLEILILRLAAHDSIKIKHLISTFAGLITGYGLVKIFISVHNIHVVSRLDFMLSKSLHDWIVLNASNFPMTIYSLFNVHWLILMICFLMFFRKDKIFYSISLGLLLLNYSIVFFTLDTTRIFSLLSWGILIECMFHSHKLSQTEFNGNFDYSKQFLQALILIGLFSFITPRYYSWIGEIHTPPFYEFWRNLIR